MYPENSRRSLIQLKEDASIAESIHREGISLLYSCTTRRRSITKRKSNEFFIFWKVKKFHLAERTEKWVPKSWPNTYYNVIRARNFLVRLAEHDEQSKQFNSFIYSVGLHAFALRYFTLITRRLLQCLCSANSVLVWPLVNLSDNNFRRVSGVKI